MSEILQKCKGIYERLKAFLSTKGINIELHEQNSNSIIIIKLIHGDVIVGNITLFIVPGDDMEPIDHISIGWVGVNEEYRGQKISYILLFLGITYTYLLCQYNLITLDDDTDKREDYIDNEHYKRSHLYGKIGFESPTGDYNDNERISLLDKSVDTYKSITDQILGVKDISLKTKAILATKEFIQQQNKLLISKSREAIKKFKKLRRSTRSRTETKLLNFHALGKEGSFVLPLNRKRKISSHSRSARSRSMVSRSTHSRSMASRSAHSRSMGSRSSRSRSARSLGGNKRKTKKNNY